VTAALPAQLPHMSEIDKIFAAKGNAKLIDPQPPVSSHSSKHTKKKRKHKTNLPQADNPGADPPSNSKKRPEPETIIDTSSDIHPKRPRLDNPLKKVKSKRSTEKDDEAIFKDSRGSTTRKLSTILVSQSNSMDSGRTTEEGWLVYKEDELRIGEDGGGMFITLMVDILLNRFFKTLLCVHSIATVVSFFYPDLQSSCYIFFC
jgi:hypothetical protein